MAQIVQSTSKLNEDYQLLKKKNRFWIYVIIASVLLSPLTGGLSFLFILLAIIMLNKRNKNTNVLKAGVSGEKAATKVFQNLSDDYTVFHDLTVIFEGKPSQIDHVIVGPTGVFIVETKNIKGRISGLIDESQWTVTKVGRKGGVYDKRLYSPVKQVGTHVYRLSNFLRDNTVHTWVQGVVYFSNHETKISIEKKTSKDIPVFAAKNGGSFDLLKYIEQTGNTLSKEKQVKTIKLLRTLVS
jgi:hypothetical protein